jgi:hypothetical protein
MKIDSSEIHNLFFIIYFLQMLLIKVEQIHLKNNIWNVHISTSWRQ